MIRAIVFFSGGGQCQKTAPQRVYFNRTNNLACVTCVELCGSAANLKEIKQRKENNIHAGKQSIDPYQ